MKIPRKPLKILLYAQIAGLLFVCNVWAAPIINSASGGSISGQNFGTKSPAAPAIWDDFESGSNGSNLANGWTVYKASSGYAKYSNAQAYSGNLSAWNSITQSATSQEFRTAWKTYTASDTSYSCWKFKYTVTGSDLYGIMKLSRDTSNYSGAITNVPHYNGPGDTVSQFQPSSSWFYRNFNTGNSSSQANVSGMSANSWKTIEQYKKLSTPGVANGGYYFKVNNSLKNSVSNFITRESGFTFQMNSHLLGLMYANVRSGTTFNMYVDDVYVDITQARVMVGNQASYASCSQIEVQIPTAWSSTSISFTENQGALSATGNYIYVIDASGNVSNGKPYSFGEASPSDTATPTLDSITPADGTTNVEID